MGPRCTRPTSSESAASAAFFVGKPRHFFCRRFPSAAGGRSTTKSQVPRSASFFTLPSTIPILPGDQSVTTAPGRERRPVQKQALTCYLSSALGGTRTPNLLIRSQMLYPLSYERRVGGVSVPGCRLDRGRRTTSRDPPRPLAANVARFFHPRERGSTAF